MQRSVFVRNKVKKHLSKIPKKDRMRIKSAFLALNFDSFSGDVEKMEGEDNSWRRRVGSYRVFYEIITSIRTIYIFRVERRTTKTYGKR